jgi:hypothetical protein
VTVFRRDSIDEIRKRARWRLTHVNHAVINGYLDLGAVLKRDPLGDGAGDANGQRIPRFEHACILHHERAEIDAQCGCRGALAGRDFVWFALRFGNSTPVNTMYIHRVFVFVKPKKATYCCRIDPAVAEPTKVKELAASLGIVQSQADVWLKRLIAEGHVKKEKMAYRAVIRASDQPTLF